MSLGYPDNEFTRMIEAVAGDNRAGVRREGVASATPLPTVQSADLGRSIPEQPELTLEERENLDRLAREAGIQDSRLAEPGTDMTNSNYGTLAEAIAAGESVAPIIERVPAGTQGLQAEYTARALGAVRNPQETKMRSVPRLPDFRKVEGIDLVNNRVVLDGMDFPIDEADVAGFKEYVVSIAHAAIMSKLNEAMSLFSTPEVAEESDGGQGTEGESTAVQPE